MNNNKPKNQYKSDSFFEAFRELGSQAGRTAKDTFKDLGSDMVDQIIHKPRSPQSLSGELNMNEHLDIDLEIKRREETALKKQRAHLEQVRRQEKMVFSRKEQELKEQIISIQEELKKELEKLAEEAGGLIGELEVAVDQNIVDPGTYHLNFFDKIRQLFIILRKKIHDSRTWMHAVNMRASHKSYFWGQVGNSGSKFLLSHERTMATQAG